MDNCTLNCIAFHGNFSPEQTCSYVSSACVQDNFQFIQAYYCLFNESFFSLILLTLILLILVYHSLDILASNHLTPCVQEFVDRLSIAPSNVEISPGLAGTTFLAFANGAPDVITAVVAGNSSSKQTALIPFGSIYGAGLFDMAYVFALVILMSPMERIDMDKNQSITPLIFYIVGSAFLLLTSQIYGKMNIYLAMVPLILYAIFIAIVLVKEKQFVVQEDNFVIATERQALAGCSKPESDNPLAKESLDLAPPIQTPKLSKLHSILAMLIDFCIPPISKDRWEPIKTLVSLLISPFIIAMSQNLPQLLQSSFNGSFTMFYISLPSIILIVHTIYLSATKNQPSNGMLYTLYAFVVIVCGISIICGLLIDFLQLIQLLTHVNSVFLGLTLLAWANCIGDYMSITAFTRRGNSAIAVSATFSGQLFNFLVGFGCSLLVSSWDGEHEFRILTVFEGDTFNVISNSIVLFVLVTSFVYFGGLILTILKKKQNVNGKLGRREGVIIKWYYIGFVAVAFILALATDFFRKFACQT